MDNSGKNACYSRVYQSVTGKNACYSRVYQSVTGKNACYSRVYQSVTGKNACYSRVYQSVTQVTQTSSTSSQLDVGSASRHVTPCGSLGTMETTRLYFIDIKTTESMKNKLA